MAHCECMQEWYCIISMQEWLRLYCIVSMQEWLIMYHARMAHCVT